MNSTLSSGYVNKRQPLTPIERNQRRKLIFQDTLSLLGLTLISICIAILTYFFFHSFREHRSVLEKRWFARGEQALAANNPQYAIEAFRSALSLSAGNTTYELALAEALAQANHNEEAYAYFSTLHDAQPGDGFLNLQLARLAVKRNEPTQAIDFYRSALSGLWYGQGTRQRFQIRLELARYLMAVGKTTDAEGDLLTAEGNSLDQPSQLFEVAGLLRLAGDPADALSTYRRVELHSTASPSLALRSLQGEAEVAMSLGLYRQADLAVKRYNAKARQYPSATTREEKMTSQQLQDELQRLMQLIPFSNLTPSQYAHRVLLGADIAHKRYAACTVHLQSATRQNISSNDATALSSLGTQWADMGATIPNDLVDDVPQQQSLLAWTNQTETLTAKLCGTPTGDDALLLQLAQTPDKTE